VPPWFPPRRAEGSWGRVAEGFWLAGPPEGIRFLVGLASARRWRAVRASRAGMPVIGLARAAVAGVMLFAASLLWDGVPGLGS
jgi:hypothetical protein